LLVPATLLVSLAGNKWERQTVADSDVAVVCIYLALHDQIWIEWCVCMEVLIEKFRVHTVWMWWSSGAPTCILRFWSYDE
jgi:hypothetical protein